MNGYEITTVETAPLGHPFMPRELERQCRAVIGAVAWPGKRPGFGLILAVTGGRSGVPYGLYLLDEAEDGDLLKLVLKCDVLDSKYAPERWIGDNRKAAAQQAMWRVAEAKQSQNGESARAFTYVCCTALVEDDGLYQYAVPMLGTLLREEDRQLFIKDSGVREYLQQINKDDLPILQRGDFPAIEALAYAAQAAEECRKSDEWSRKQPREHNERPRSAMAF